MKPNFSSTNISRVVLGLCVLCSLLYYSRASFAGEIFNTDTTVSGYRIDNVLTGDNNGATSLSQLEILFVMLNESQNYGNTRMKADLHSRIAGIYERNGMYERALEHYSAAYNLYSSQKNYDENCLEGMVWTLYDIGNMYYRIEDYNYASQIYFQCTKLFAQSGDMWGVASSFSNIGLCYYQQNLYGKALEYYSKALEIRLRMNNPDLIAASLSHLGSVYAIQENYIKAEEYYNKAIYYYLKTENLSGIAYVYMHLGDICSEKGEHNKAVENYLLAVDFSKSANNIQYLISAYESLARGYQGLNQFDAAEKTLLDAQYLVEQSRNIEQQNSLFNAMYHFYSKAEKYREALYFYQKFQDTETRMKTKTLDEKFKQMEFWLLSEQMRNTIYQLEREQLIQKLENKNKTNILYYFLFSSLFLILFIFSNLRKFNDKFELLKEYVSGYSILEKLFTVFVFALYYALFLFIFKPFGFEEMHGKINLFDFFVTGLFSALALFLSLALFYIIVCRTKNAVLPTIRYLVYSVTSLCLSAGILFSYLVLRNYSEPSWFLYFSSLTFLLICNVLPVYIIIIVIEKYILQRNIQAASEMSRKIHEITPHEQKKAILILSSPVTKEELITDPSELICIEAQGNYCKVTIIADGKVQSKMIRLSMKSAEEQTESFSELVRCHKSYIVNILHVDHVSGNSRGHQLHMKMENMLIPVSRTFPKTLLSRSEGK